jgi:hypothetical protein
MGPYSHYFLAQKLEAHLQPAQPDEYYWGAIIPDIRYLAQMHRSHTHLSQERLSELGACYPHLKSFLLGYQVHCLIDQIELSPLINASFPMNLMKRMLHRNFSPQQITMLIEFYYLQTPIPPAKMSGSSNEILLSLGITPQQTSLYFQGMQEYFQAHSLDAAISTYQKMFMIENHRLEKYMKAYQSMKRRKLVNGLFMLSVRNAGVDQHVIDFVGSRINK